MEQKPESAVSLYEILRYLHNFFPGDRWTCADEPIKDGHITFPGLEDGDIYLIEGSRRNDGLHVYGNWDLRGETLTGYVTECRIPPELLALADEISAWQTKNAEALESPYQSESFGGYSYTKVSGSSATGEPVSWKTVYAPRLRTWRKL